MFRPPARRYAAGLAALFLLTVWACNCGTLQGLVASGEQSDANTAFADTPTAIPQVTGAPTEPPPTAIPTDMPSATTAPTPTITPTEPPTATPTPMGLLFEDDFSDPATGWRVDDTPDEGSYAYVDGVYAIAALKQGTLMWGWAGRSLGDAAITVDAVQISAPANDNNSYGVGCRLQGDGAGYYLRISGDGYYSIIRVTNDPETDEETFTELVDWTLTDAINLGNASNVVEVTCDGPDLSLRVNEQIVATAQDDTFAAGDIALLASTYEDEPTTIHFDNLVVREP